MKDIQSTEEVGKSELHISAESNWSLSEKIAGVLENELNGVWVEKTDGIDQRYWDLKIENEVITLHLEHYLGILAFSDSRSLLLRAKQTIESKALKTYDGC